MARKLTKRRMTAKILHVGCNAMDSIRIMAWREIMGEPHLTEKEHKLLTQRYNQVQQATAEIRQIARHLEK